jgi:hypothetical protein
MIIIKIQGGLGNQMFQYALGRNLSLIHNVPFKIDSSYLRSANQSGRSFCLDNFNAVLDEATEEEINAYRSTFQKILDRLRLESKKKKISDILRNPDIFYQNVLNRSDGYFDGFWNNEKYFKERENVIKQDFKLKKPFEQKALEMSKKIDSEQNATSLNIRRGDYISIQKIANVFNELNFSYYEQAMKIILEKHSDAHFFISSDDIGWVKENFPKNYPVTFVSCPEIVDYEELTLMSLCKHNIIANSTFSWWAAWLNQNLNKIVIAPKKWYRDDKLNLGNKIPNTWIQI